MLKQHNFRERFGDISYSWSRPSALEKFHEIKKDNWQLYVTETDEIAMASLFVNNKSTSSLPLTTIEGTDYLMEFVQHFLKGEIEIEGKKVNDY